jgi:hypothetical protein
MLEPVARHYGLPLSTSDHSVQQGREDLDYAEYEEGTSPNVFLRAFEKVRGANAIADDLQILTIFSLFLPNKVLLWHDCYLNDHPDCSWAELKKAFCKRYGGEPWQEQTALEQRVTITPPQLTKGLVNQQKGDSIQAS